MDDGIAAWLINHTA